MAKQNGERKLWNGRTVYHWNKPKEEVYYDAPPKTEEQIEEELNKPRDAISDIIFIIKD